MTQNTSIKEETLAKAAVIFCQKVFSMFPEAHLTPLDQHYSDEDLTVAVSLPAGVDVRQASDELIKIALQVEDQYDVSIIARAESS